MSTVSCGPHLGNPQPTHTYLTVYGGDGGSNHHLDHLINVQQVFTVQNEYVVNPTVESIQMGAKPGIADYQWVPVLLSTLMDNQVGPTRYLGTGAYLRFFLIYLLEMQFYCCTNKKVC